MEKVVEKLKEKGHTIATMESCTGGAVVNAITNVEGASSVLQFSAVTYSNEFKIKMGVHKETIDKYTVYSKETAMHMANTISKFANSTYGIGVTGKINRKDENNLYGEDNKIFICVYDSINNIHHVTEIEAISGTRAENKNYIVKEIEKLLLEII